MESKYSKYSVEQLADDKLFVAWVLKGHNSREWDRFAEKNADFSKNAVQAREIILLLLETTEVLDKKDELEMWNNIESFSNSQKKKVRTLNLRRSLYWAASFLLLLSISTIAFIYLGEENSRYKFLSEETQNETKSIKILLSNGNELTLGDDNSILALNEDYELMINNDTIIDLSPKEIKQKVQMNEVIIPYGKKSELLLADGTKVWLNAGTCFAFPSKFTEKTRKVFLDGEAYFEVAENKTQPFIVNADNLTIRVLGTNFNVSAYDVDDKIETILLKGSIAVGKSKTLGLRREEVIMKPYQKASFDKQENEVLISNEPNADNYITWTEGMFQFSRENLLSVFTKLERFYDVGIEIPQNFHSLELISGKLDLKESIGDVMVVLGDVAKIEYHIEEKIIYIDKHKISTK